MNSGHRTGMWVSFVSAGTLPELEKKVNDEIMRLEELEWDIKNIEFQVTANSYYALIICN
jgi:hypothetical protein